MGWAVVCADVEVAAVLVTRGAQVVLCAHDRELVGSTVMRLRGLAEAGGRVAAMVGDLDDPEVESAAVAMAAELFGGQATVVRSVSEACQQMPTPPVEKRQDQVPFESTPHP